MARQIALLRGINLGPSRRVSMPALRELLTGLGYGDVRTLLQSGNVVLTSDDPPERLGRELRAHIAEGLGIDSEVVVRTRDELADVVARDPFGELVDDPRRYQVTFLSAPPDGDAVRRLEALDVAPERFLVSGREIYAWHPNGIQRSQLARLLSDRELGAVATARNWNTVLGLLELADEG